MALKTILESLDGVEEQFHSLYEEKDGKFVLQLEGIDDHPAVIALRNGHQNSKRERDEARRKLAEAEQKLAEIPDDFDADEWARLKAEEEARNNDPNNQDTRRQIEAAVAAARQQEQTKAANEKKRLEAQIADLTKQLEARTAQARKRLVEDGLSEALEAAGVTNPAFKKAARALLRDMIEVVEIDGEELAQVKSDHGGGDIKTFVSNWVQTDEGKPFVTPMRGADEAGSNSRRSAGPNPFTPEHWNVTEQGRLARDERAKAESLARAAGFKDLDEALRSVGPKPKS